MSTYTDFNFNNRPDDEYVSVRVTLTPRQAREGLLCTLRYPGAPEALKVELPSGMRDGMALFVDAPFYENYGDIVERPLRILISVRRPSTRSVAAFALICVAAAALIVMISVLSGALRRDGVQSEALPQPSQQAVQEVLPSAAVSPAAVAPEVSLSAVQQRALALIPHFDLRCYINQLDDRLLENFLALYSAVSGFEAQCTFPQPLSKDELANLTLLLSYECPELLQFSAATEITFYSDAEANVVSAILPYSLTPEEYAREYAVCDGVAKALAQKARGLSELDKELIAYNYLVSNCFYRYDAPNAFSAYGALGDREAKCDGISLAMKWLCEEMGVSCMVMAGNAPDNPIGHAWNIICVDGTYYDLDVTNDIPSAERQYCYYGAFNVSKYWIRNKYPENVSFSGFVILPGSESMNMSYHALNGSYVAAGEAYEDALFRRLSELSSGEAAFIQFESWDEYTAFINNINDIMSRWNGLSKGSFNYSLSHLDDFQVCRISVTYL